MSPLACSLFALAALLAAADAQMVQRCSTKIIGPVTSDFQQPLASEGLPYGPSQIDFKNLCGSAMINVGEKITVCNKSLNDYPAPVISAPDDGSVSPVSVYCADLAGCTAEPMSESCNFNY